MAPIPFMRRTSLSVKLLLSFVLILSLTFFSTGYFSYRYNLNIAEDEIGEQFSQIVEQLQARLTLRLQETYRLSSYINFEPYAMRALQESDYALKYADLVQLQRLLNQIMTDSPHILFISLYDTAGNDHRPESAIMTIDLDQETYEQILARSEHSDGEIVWMRLPYFEYHEDSRKNEVVVAVRKLKNRELKTYGTMVMFLHEQIFENELKNSIRGDKSNVYLFDNQNQLIYSDDEGEPDDMRPSDPRASGMEIKEIEGDTYIVAQSYSEQTGFTLVSRISTNTLHEKSKVIFQVALLNGAISILLAGGLLLFASRKLLRPLKQLVSGMKRVRNGRLDTRITVNTTDELSYIGDGFNSLIGEINRLIKEVYEKQLLQSRAELAALQAQLNPHFLYNTLDMIHGRLYLQGDVDSADVIVALSRMLRYALEPAESSTTLARELEQLKNYLKIQQLRFEDQWELRLRIEDEVADCEITRLLLQPIVENVFVHAFRDQLDNKKLSIAAYRDRDFLVVEVKDSGCGMPPELVGKINRAEFDRDPRTTGGIGVSNVIKRIGMIYGPPYRLEAESRPAEGTKMTLYLPYNKINAQEGRETG